MASKMKVLRRRDSNFYIYDYDRLTSEESNKETCRGYDFTDYAPDGYPYTRLDVAANVLSIISFCFDIGTDIALVIFYYQYKEWWWSALTLLFIVVPSVTMTIFSLVWYYLDHKMNMKFLSENERVHVPAWKWVLRIAFCLLQLSPILRYLDSIHYGLKSQRVKDPKEKRKLYKLMLYEDADSTLLRLFECFMESAPQLVFQVYILIRQGTEADWFKLTIQLASIVTSIVSLSWSLVAYSKALRYTREDKSNISYAGMVFMFLWRMCVIIPRVLVMGLFASYFQAWIAAFMAIHWILMFVWLDTQKTNFFTKKWADVLLKFVLAIVYIFCYFNILEGRTRWRYLAYYTLQYIENGVLIVLWYYFTGQPHEWYRTPSIVGILSLFWCGMFFMGMYYKCFHPIGRGKLDTCVAFSDETEVDGDLSPNSNNLSTNSLNLSPRNGIKMRPFIPTENENA